MKTENGKLKMNNDILNKKNLFLNPAIFRCLLALLACVFLCFALASCADADGLHNQPELLVTFEFSGFGDVSGNYSIPGNFDGNNGWDNTKIDVVMKNGRGVSNEISVTTTNIQFSLCPTNEWTRPWYAAGSCEGNGADGSNGMRNFYIDNLDLSKGTATVVVEVKNGSATPESTSVTK